MISFCNLIGMIVVAATETSESYILIAVTKSADSIESPNLPYPSAFFSSRISRRSSHLSKITKNKTERDSLAIFLNMDDRKGTAYRALRDQENGTDISHLEEPELARLSSLSRIYRRLFMSISVGIIAVFATFTIYRLFCARSIIDQCGTTPAEARAKGCVFEMTGFSWLPKQCSDPEVETEFLSSLDLQYYRDMNYTQQVSLDEVKRGDGAGFFVKQDYHLAHCAFLFKKLHRAISQGRKVDGLISPVHHTDHCVHMLLGPPNNRWDAVQFAFTKYPYCGKDGGYNVDWKNQGKWIG
jgi:hypothetical protein